MKLQRGSSASARALPPHLAALRRRDADVDIVVLPPEVPSRGVPVGDGGVEATRAEVAGLAAQVWSGATDVPAVPVTKVGYGPGPGTVVVKSRILVRVPAGEQVVEAMAAALDDDGWRVGRAADGPRLVARRDDVFARVSYAVASGALLVELASDPIPVGADRAREMVRQ